MRKSKSLSSFSISAVALLVAAVPCFAQNQSSGPEVKSGLVADGNVLDAIQQAIKFRDSAHRVCLQSKVPKLKNG